MAKQQKIIVTGDVAIDKLSVRVPKSELGGGADETGEMTGKNWQQYRGTRVFTCQGGACLLSRLVEAATGTGVFGPCLDNMELSPEQLIHSYARLERYPEETGDEERFVYRVGEYEGFDGPREGKPCFPAVKNEPEDADIVVIDDAGNGFRDEPAAWPRSLTEGSPPVVLKMNGPLAEGELWEHLQQWNVKGGPPWEEGVLASRLVVVIEGEDLRRSGFKLSRRVSWERTVMELVWQIECNPGLVDLRNCQNLIVRFDMDGAITRLATEEGPEYRLFFDPRRSEGGYREIHPGQMLGKTDAFIAALASNLCEGWTEEQLRSGVAEGIRASRRHHCLGFGGDLDQIDFRCKRLFDDSLEESAPDDSADSPSEDPAGDASEGSANIPDNSTDETPPIAQVRIQVPADKSTEDPDFWCILEQEARACLESIATHYVLRGEHPTLDRVPMGQFGKLKTLDRSENESYGSIQNLMREYLRKSDATRPLSIAVFGPPGSGKSFGVQQVAESVAPGRIEQLEFNLSQLDGPHDLIPVFRRVRDEAFGERIPLVFFDEFDSDLDDSLGWLKHFLSPMQDGMFRDGESFHPIGKAIFVFAGGICHSFEEFADQQQCRLDQTEDSEHGRNDEEDLGGGPKQFREAKGPDFLSRLRGFVNVKGPNPGEEESEEEGLHMIRRAIMLRVLLKRNAPQLFDHADRLRIDRGVLRALICVPRYKHGTRSISAIIEMSTLTGRRSFQQAALPPDEQLNLHVDAEDFSELLTREVLLGSVREKIACQIHEAYVNKRKEEGKYSPDDPALSPWEELSEEYKKSNRAQAEHIVPKLNAVDCSFRPEKDADSDAVRFTETEIELLAEMEHRRYNAERFADGWRYGPERDLKNKTNPYLVPWDELPEDVKDYDRQAVEAIPQLLADVGFELYRLAPSSEKENNKRQPSNKPAQ